MKDDPHRLVSVAGCGSVGEADMLKIALEGEGIEAVVEGGELSTALGHTGSALGDVKILVRASAALRAKAIVIAKRESCVAPDRDPWFCGKCLEEVTGGFEICWSCGLVRDDVEAPFPATADAIEMLDLREVAVRFAIFNALQRKSGFVARYSIDQDHREPFQSFDVTKTK